MPGANGSHGGGNGSSNGPGSERAGGLRRPPAASEPRGRAERARAAFCWITTSCMTSCRSCASRISTATRTRSIYQAIRDLYDQGKGIDAVTLADELTSATSSKTSAATTRSTEIVNSVPHAANAKYYAEIVKEKSINRQLIESATEIIRDGYSNQFTARGAARVGRAEDLRHRRGPDPGRHARAQGRPQAGDGPDRRSGPRRRTRGHRGRHRV